MSAAERRALALAGVAVFVSRWPWMLHDYGSDPDSYRVVSSARQLLRTGNYQPSRLPGYPLYEGLSALTATSSPWVSNGLTALFSAAAVVLFALILRALQVPRYLLLALGFSMVPVIYVSSCCTMDYVPSLTFALASVYVLLQARPLLAGILLGLAMGCRLTAGALVLPLLLWLPALPGMSRPWRSMAWFLAGAGLVGTLCFLPLYRLYGSGFFTFFDNDGYPPAEVVWSRSTTLVWGQIGCLALALWLCSLPLWHARLRRAWLDPFHRRTLLIALLAVSLYLIAFLRLPDEAGYLVPLVPWVLIAVAVVTPASGLMALALALLLSPWLSFHGGRVSLEGAILEDHRVRASQDQATTAILQTVTALPGRAVVVCGWILPRITLVLDGDTLGPHQFVYLVEDEDDYRRYVSSGRQIYYLPGVDLYESQAHQLELPELGARQLDVPRERQRPASSGE